MEQKDINTVRDIKIDHYKKKNNDLCNIYYMTDKLGLGYKYCNNIPKSFSYCKYCLDNPFYKE